jgi:hypothetical protein
MRFFALVDWLGGPLVREAKISTLSAWLWAEGQASGENQIIHIVNNSVRSPDPFLKMLNGWLVRPIAADCGRIDLDAVEINSSKTDRHNDQLKLIRAMGFETANIHLGSVSADELASAAKKVSLDGLKRATQGMFTAVDEDFRIWKKYWNKSK